MKYRLLELLVCPACRHPFYLSNEVIRNGEVDEGILSSDCGRKYPILRGIPRILPDAFVLGSQIPKPGSARGEVDKFRFRLAKTSRSFGFQWTKFKKIDEGDKATFLAKTLWTPDSFSGKLVLDAGCGFGRYTYFSAKFGAEAVGIDLSAAVESARINTADLPNVHLVQGDLLSLPFRQECFDRIYSIGVLHHTPDPPAAFESVSSVLRPGGDFSIWVYDRGDIRRETINTLLRSTTTRLPHPALWRICGFAARFSTSQLIQGLRNFVIIGSSRVGNFDWYSPQYQHHLTEAEVFSWFELNGFSKILLISPPARGFGSSFGARGVKRRSMETMPIIVEKVATSFDKLVDSDVQRSTVISSSVKTD